MPETTPLQPHLGEFAWEEWLLLPEKLAIHLPTQTALVGDLHLGYLRIRNLRGDCLPEIPLKEELAPLVRALGRHQITQWACAGDLFEKGGEEKLEKEFQREMTAAGLNLIAIVPGNHDRKGSWEENPLPWKPEGFLLGDWSVFHGDKVVPHRGKQVTGHRHPVISFKKGPKHPCFLLSENHMILPAYSNEVSGVSVLKEFKGKEWRCVAVGSKGCVDLGTMDGVYKLAHPPRTRRENQ